MSSAPHPPTTPLAVPNHARLIAQQTRADWLVSVGLGVVSVQEVIEAASLPENRPLLKITLAQLLLAQPGWGSERTKAFIRRLRETLEVAPAVVPKPTIGWLLDGRTGGRRFLAWADALTPKDAPPWPGFPFASPGTRP